MLEAARVVKVMEEGVKGRRTVWERVRERMGEDGGGGSALPADDSDSDSDSDDEIPISALAYLADSVDLLALAYHNVLVMLRDYGSQMISEGAVQDGRRIRGEMEGGGKKRKRGEEEDVAVTGSKETEFVEKAVTMIKEGEAKVLRGLAMIKEKVRSDEERRTGKAKDGWNKATMAYQLGYSRRSFSALAPRAYCLPT